MRVVTFNILHGRAPGGDVDATRLRECVQRLNPDVLALQEVDRDQERSGRVDLTAVAAEAMNASAHRFAAAISGTPGAAWAAATGAEHPESAAYGVALLSRYPATDWRVLRLPRARLPFDAEPRLAVAARLDTPLGALAVASTHLSFLPGRNRRQLRGLVSELAELTGPRVVLGDLNMSVRAARRWSGLRPLAVAATFPAAGPRRQLDHILTDDTALTVLRCAAPAMPISDHRPLVVDLQRR